MQLLPSTLAGLALAAFPLTAQAQTWSLDIDPATTQTGLDLALSAGGQVCAVGSFKTPTLLSNGAVTIYDPQAQRVAEYDLVPLTGGTVELNRVLFEGEDTLILAGSTQNQPFLGAVDAMTGVGLWDLSYTQLGSFTHLAKFPDGGYLVAGEFKPVGSKDLMVVRTDALGNKLWSFDYQSLNLEITCGGLGIDDQGRAFLLVDTGSILRLVRLSPEGDVELARNIPFSGLDPIETEIAVAADGGLWVGWMRSLSGGLKTYVHRLTADFEPLHGLEIALPGSFGTWSGLRGMAATPDGGLLIGAELRNSTSSGETDAAVVRVDGEGQLDWARRLTTGGEYFAPALVATPDGGYFALSEGEQASMRLVRANAAGEVGACSGAFVTAATQAAELEVQGAFFSKSALTTGIESRPVTPNTVVRPSNVACGEDCQFVGSSYGGGSPGSFGIIPTLEARNGLCLTYGPSLEIENGLGGAVSFVGASLVPALYPLFEGFGHLNPATTVYLPPIVLDGTPGAPGAGGATIEFGGDLSNAQGEQIHFQAFILDPASFYGVVLTNAALLTGI